MLRKGYVGRNIVTGDFNRILNRSHQIALSNNFEPTPSNDVRSTAQSLTFIGFSGSGKTTTLNRILKTINKEFTIPSITSPNLSI